MDDMQSVWSRRAYRLGLLAVLLLGLAACAVTGSRIKAYDGPELAKDQTATLEAPATIKVVSVNGRDTSSYLLEDLALNYSLRPGSNTVVFRYRSIWSTNTVREDGDSAVDIVESDLVEARFEAQPGETYRFAGNQAGNVREARRLARDFNPTIVTGSGETVVQADPYAGQREAVAAAPEPAPAAPIAMAERSADGEAIEAQTVGGDSGMSTLDALNLLWKRATREEKEAFLEQAFEVQ